VPAASIRWLDRDTRAAEKNYKALGGNFTVIIQAGRRAFSGRAAGSEARGGFHSSKKQLTRMQTTKSKRTLVLGLGIAGLAGRIRWLRECEART